MDLNDYLAAYRSASASFDDAEIDRVVGKALRQRPSRPVRARRAVAVATIGVAATMVVVSGFATARLLGNGPGPAPVAASSGDRIQPVDDVETTSLFATETATDIVSWSDQMVLATVVASDPVSAPENLSSTGSDDGLLTRNLTFRVDQTVWARAGAATVPQTFQSTAWGWVVTGGQPALMQPKGEIAFEVGKQYLVSVTLEGADWLTLGQASLAVTGSGALAGPAEASTFVSSLEGKTIADAGVLLKSATPLRGIAQFTHLPLKDRLRSYGRFLTDSGAN